MIPRDKRQSFLSFLSSPNYSHNQISAHGRQQVTLLHRDRERRSDHNVINRDAPCWFASTSAQWQKGLWQETPELILQTTRSTHFRLPEGWSSWRRQRIWRKRPFPQCWTRDCELPDEGTWTDGEFEDCSHTKISPIFQVKCVIL